MAMRSIFFPITEISETAKRELPIKISHIFGKTLNEAKETYQEIQKMKPKVIIFFFIFSIFIELDLYASFYQILKKFFLGIRIQL